jgi:hypothetical protein
VGGNEGRCKSIANKRERIGASGRAGPKLEEALGSHYATLLPCCFQLAHTHKIGDLQCVCVWYSVHSSFKLVLLLQGALE